MAKDHAESELDRELENLPSELSWREWIRRIEAVLFASASPVPRRGAPYIYVTTEKFLTAFDMEILQDLPDREQLEDSA